MPFGKLLFTDKGILAKGSDRMSDLIFGLAALALSIALGIATVYSIRIYLEI